MLKNKTILITGGTGSLGKVLTRRLLEAENGKPEKIIIFSRDEAKQHQMRLEYLHKKNATEESIYSNFERILEFRIGDVRNFDSVSSAMRDADIVINAAAMKQVPTCEYFPFEAVQTNIIGAQNIVKATMSAGVKVQTVIGVSTDKACKPVNVMGMTKALQERIFISANITTADTRFVCVRYGNVLASRGSVIPLFHEQITNGGPVTLTTLEMTRFLLSLEKAVDVVFAALADAKRGEIFIPKVPAAKMVDIAKALIGERKIKLEVTGIRPGEKVHEILVSEEESWRTYDRGDYMAIQSNLPELRHETGLGPVFNKEYSSGEGVLTLKEIEAMLVRHDLMLGADMKLDGEFLR